jgi:hypothetical protein
MLSYVDGESARPALLGSGLHSVDHRGRRWFTAGDPSGEVVDRSIEEACAGGAFPFGKISE